MNNVNALVAKILGAVLVVVGILGFIPALVGAGGTGTLIMFGVNPLHNVIHLATGAILLAVGFMADGKNARMTNQVIGVVYLLVAILGFAGILVPDLLNTTADTVMHADNVLHLLLGIVLAGVGFGVKETTTMPMGTRPA